jgi:hypothetical protein
MILFIAILISILVGFGAGYTWGQKVSEYKMVKQIDKILEMMKR